MSEKKPKSVKSKKCVSQPATAPKCEHVIGAGTAGAKRCTAKAVANGFCKRHTKKIVPTDLSHDKILADELPNIAQEKKEPKYKFSIFKFTLNSNIDYSTMDANEKDKFKNAMNTIFTTENIHKFLIDRSNLEDPRDHIAEIKVKWHPEIGPKFHKLHAHGIVWIKHTGNYLLNSRSIKATFDDMFGKSIHFQVSASGDSEREWDQYISKAGDAHIPKL